MSENDDINDDNVDKTNLNDNQIEENEEASAVSETNPDEKELAPHEIGTTSILDTENKKNVLDWIKENKVTTAIISSLLILAIVGGSYYAMTRSDVIALKENVVPHRIGYEDSSQQFIADDKIIPGGAKGTITTVDNQQRGANVSAPWIAIDATGNDQAATLAPPEDLSKVGWYGRSAWFGQNKGSTVMVSHINYAGMASYGSIFISLRKGDPVTITDQDGNEWHYVVTEDPYYLDKNSPDYIKQTNETINKMDGENELVLVTCGGDYVGGTLGYADNIIVKAKLANNTEKGINKGK